MVDLRSDTVTRPTPAMREAMLSAPVGDDVYGEDPTVNALEERMAALFGHEAGVFCPSGTMTNQIACHVHTRHGDEIICEEGAHIYRYEGAGLMATSGCSVKFVAADRGRFTAAMVAAAVNDPEQTYLARTRLVNIENTSNRGGGSCWNLPEVLAIRRVCDAHGLRLHMDGARIFNALVARAEDPKAWGAPFDSVSICLSKGLGAPVGSVLIGPGSFIKEARRVRKRLGGGMRQAGMLAAAGLHALDHHLDRLVQDHERAAVVATVLEGLPGVVDVLTPETNIVIYMLQGEARTHVEWLRAAGIMAHAIGPQQVRLVFHLDVTDRDVELLIDTLKRCLA
jgi:threonine aldolase